MTLFFLNIYGDILKNVGNQTTLEPTALRNFLKISYNPQKKVRKSYSFGTTWASK